jgi:hypothetical protein
MRRIAAKRGTGDEKSASVSLASRSSARLTLAPVSFKGDVGQPEGERRVDAAFELLTRAKLGLLRHSETRARRRRGARTGITSG